MLNFFICTLQTFFLIENAKKLKKNRKFKQKIGEKSIKIFTTLKTIST